MDSVVLVGVGAPPPMLDFPNDGDGRAVIDVADLRDRSGPCDLSFAFGGRGAVTGFCLISHPGWPKGWPGIPWRSPARAQGCRMMTTTSV